jgi:glycosyltransferase involved in cell wall biosynthesis
MGELFGGVERHILDLCRYFTRNGLPTPTVILFFDRALGAKLREQGVEPVIVRGRNRYDPALIGRIADVLRRTEADVLHVHGYKAAIVGGLAAARVGCPVVKTEHGMPEATLANPVSWVKSRFNTALDRWATRRHIAHVCYVTEDIKRAYDGIHTGVARSTVHNGIDPLRREDYPRPDDLPTGTCNVGIVGRVRNVKGIPFAIEALGRPEVPERVHLHVIGTGPLEDELRERAKAAGLAARVHFHGFRDNIYDYLAHLDLLLMPSLHEGLPYTLLEAWSLGCPLAVSRVGGLAEVVREGAGMALYAVGAVAEIAGAMAGACREGGERPVLPECPYTLQAMAGRYLEVFGGLVATEARAIAGKS